MLKSAGIHQNFGWKPIGKHEFTASAGLIFDPVTWDWSRTIKMCYALNIAISTFLSIKINGAATGHDYTAHFAGDDAGALCGCSNAVNGANSRITHYPGRSKFGEITIKLHPELNRLVWFGSSWEYFDATHYAFTQTGGGYSTAGPYTIFNLYPNGSNMTGQLEIFQSVYGF